MTGASKLSWNQASITFQPFLTINRRHWFINLTHILAFQKSEVWLVTLFSTSVHKFHSQSIHKVHSGEVMTRLNVPIKIDRNNLIFKSGSFKSSLRILWCQLSSVRWFQFCSAFTILWKNSGIRENLEKLRTFTSLFSFLFSSQQLAQAE